MTQTLTLKEDLYKKFIDWYVTPVSDKKNLPTILEFQKRYSLQDEDIRDFANSETFSDDIVEASIKWGKSKFPELIRSTYESYMEKKNPQMLLAYQKLLEFNKDKGQNININMMNISDDRFQQIISRSRGDNLPIIEGEASVLN